ncbi:hypothetical protein Tco_1295493 [Tanacetum coccineum]
MSRYTSNPGTQHWQAIQRVLKYLKKTIDYRLTYTGYPLVLEGYTDAFKKQTCITGSTMEYEFVALAAAGKEAKWLKNLLLEIPLWSKPLAPISIGCVSAATLAKAYSQMYNGKSRHLGVRHSMIREMIMNEEDEVVNFLMVHFFEKVLSRSMNKDEPPIMSVVYVLTTSIPEDGGDDATVEKIRKRAKWDNDDYDSLEAKYMAEDASSKKFLMNMDEAIKVSCIIDKLLPSWKDFKHTLKHKKEELTLVELGSHLHIEESLRVHDSDKPKGNNVVGPQ